MNLDQEATGRTNAKPATQRSRSTNTNLPGKQIFDDGRHTPFGELDTLPRLLQYQASVRSNKTAIRKKEFGIWHTWSWANVAEEVRAFACGLAARGFSQGDNLGIVGDIRARLYWAIVAAQSLGGIAVPLYSEASADEMARVINELGTRFIVVQDQEQVDKLIKIKAQCPSLEGIIYVDPRGMRHYHELYLIKYDDMRSKGREFHVLQPDYFHQQLSRGSGEDVAFVLQTAGTTGTPKSVLLTHNNVLATASSSISELALTDKEQVLAFLPMAMATSILFYLAQPLIAGFCVSYPESDETVLSDLRDIGPTFLFASSHFYKGLHNSVMSQMTGATAIKRYFFHHIMSAPRNAAFSALDNILITGPLKNTLGLSRIRLALTTGDALSPVVQSFYRALGIKLRQFYGPTEGFCLVSLQPDGINERPENVGIAANNVKIDITPQGEVVFKSDTIFRGYHKNTSATISSGSASEWIHTGDAGFFGPEGQLNILGPVVHRRRLASGLELFPQSIERRLKFSPYIRDAVVFGNEREYLTALVTIDTTSVVSWAKKQNLIYSGFAELTQNDAVYALIQDAVNNANKHFYDSNEVHCQVRKFVILPRFFSTTSGELTFTNQVRRSVVEERYADLCVAMYAATDWSDAAPGSHGGLRQVVSSVSDTPIKVGTAVIY